MRWQGSIAHQLPDASLSALYVHRRPHRDCDCQARTAILISCRLNVNLLWIGAKLSRGIGIAARAVEPLGQQWCCGQRTTWVWMSSCQRPADQLPNRRVTRAHSIGDYDRARCRGHGARCRNREGQSVQSQAACEDSQVSAVTMTSLSAAEGWTTAVTVAIASV